MNTYNLDRNHFRLLTLKEADENEYASLDWKQRFMLHQYLNSIAYGYVNQETPVLDRSIFHARKLSDGEYEDCRKE
ncbi:MAG: hypothetical protein ABI761_12985 [Saprospiraceae bacterium]